VPGCPTLFQHLDEALAGKPEMGPSAKMCPRHCLWNAGFDLVKAHRPRTMLKIFPPTETTIARYGAAPLTRH
jgi:hypothetical protein